MNAAPLIAWTNATLGLLIAFDVALTETQKGAIVLFVNATMGAVFWLRSSLRKRTKP